MTGYLDAAVSGIIVKDGELRTSAKGTKFLGLTVRVGDGDGAQFVRVTCFGDAAEELAPAAIKGARLSAEGSMQADIYQGKPSLAIAARWARIPQTGKNRAKRESSVAGGLESSSRSSAGHGDRRGFTGANIGYGARSGHPAFDDEIPL